jgi:hypothetical protein
LKRKDESDFLDRNYFRDSVNSIQLKWKISTDLTATAQRLLGEQVSETLDAIDFLKSHLREINYYDCLKVHSYLFDGLTNHSSGKRWPKNLDRVLLLTLFIRENRDYLDDISDPKQRQKEALKLLRNQGSIYRNKYPFWVDLNRMATRIKSFKGKSNHYIVKNIIDIQNKTYNLYTDTLEAATQISGYIDFLSEVAQEK